MISYLVLGLCVCIYVDVCPWVLVTFKHLKDVSYYFGLCWYPLSNKDIGYDVELDLNLGSPSFVLKAGESSWCSCWSAWC